MSTGAIRIRRSLGATVLALTLLWVACSTPAGDAQPAPVTVSSDHADHEAPTTAPPPGAPSTGDHGWGSHQPKDMRVIRWGRSDEPISIERRELLGRQLDRVRDAAMAIGTVRRAVEEGYELVSNGDSGGRYEFVNFDLVDDVLDLDHPEMLVFAADDPEANVIAVAFNVNGTYEDGPPTTFPLEMIGWHYHEAICRGPSGYLEGDQTDDCDAIQGEVDPSLSTWMVDLWVIPGWENPWGLISSKHPDLGSIEPWYAPGEACCPE